MLEKEPLVREAIASAFEELEAEQPQREAELSRIDAEAKRVGESLDRYFRAFEEGTMPESACGPRIEELSRKARGLKARREELGAEEPEEREPCEGERGPARSRAEHTPRAAFFGSSQPPRSSVLAVACRVFARSRSAVPARRSSRKVS